MANAASEAKVILDQLTQSNNGSRVLQAMIGAKDIGYGTDKDGNTYVTFKFKMVKQANACTITLTGRDDYTMTFLKIQRMPSTKAVLAAWDRGEESPLVGGVKTVEEFDGLYFDMLKDVFEEFTGLYLSM